MKISDKINKFIEEGKTFYSWEYFPPKTEQGVENLFARMHRMAKLGPAFCDITWGAGGSTADLTLDIADRMQNQVNVECMMHLTCTNMPEAKLSEALTALKKFGVKNILALRGDPPAGQDKFTQVQGGFSCALDLVKYIKQNHGDDFGLAIAGYPEGHPDGLVEGDNAANEAAYQADLQYLKKKVDAGGEFIVTQLFYDVSRFIKFVKDCRDIGITVPILPGIMPIMTYNGFKKMTGFCKTAVPAEISEKLESIKDDDAAVKQYGIDLGVQMCKEILGSGVCGLHMYTLNQETSAVAILERLGLISAPQAPPSKPLQPANEKIANEQVVATAAQ